MNKIIKKHIDIFKNKSELIQSDMKQIFDNNFEFDIVYDLVRNYFERLNSEFSYIKDFSVGCIYTKDIISEPWYYNPKDYSKNAIEIVQNKQIKYIWINEGKWIIEDYIFCIESETTEDIAYSLSDWKCFEFPKDIKLMFTLIKEGYWLMSLQLPILSEKILSDTKEVYSWDDNFVLTGTMIENIDVITIEHWEKIVETERCYGYYDEFK